MSIAISKSPSPSVVASSRAAEWAVGATAALQRASGAVWQWLLAVGEQRAREHMRLLAEQYKETRPELAKVFLQSSKRLG